MNCSYVQKRVKNTWIYFLGHAQVEGVQGLGSVEGDDPLVLLHAEQNLRTLTEENDPIKLKQICNLELDGLIQ